MPLERAPVPMACGITPAQGTSRLGFLDQLVRLCAECDRAEQLARVRLDRGQVAKLERGSRVSEAALLVHAHELLRGALSAPADLAWIRAWVAPCFSMVRSQ